MKLRIIFFVELCFSFLTLRSALSSELTYDGNWWLSLTIEERQQFWEGSADCYLAYIRGPKFMSGSRYGADGLVTKYYLDNPLQKSTLVLDVMQKLSSPVDYSQLTPTIMSERYTDGEYWRQLFDVSNHTAFVRGHLACREKYSNLSARNPVSYYVNSLTAYFATNYNDPGAASEAHINHKIGDVLTDLLEKPHPSK